MNIITLAELRCLLLSIDDATIVSIVSMVEPKLKSKDANGIRNPFMLGRTLSDGFSVVKIGKAVGRVGTNYDNEVENQIRSEIIRNRIDSGLAPLSESDMADEVESRFRKGIGWFRCLYGPNGRRTPLCVHKDDTDDGAAFFRIIVSHDGKSEFVGVDGSIVDRDSVRPYEAQTNNYANQGVDNPRQIRTYYLTNILDIAIKGQRYRISDNYERRTNAQNHRAMEIANEYQTAARTMAA